MISRSFACETPPGLRLMTRTCSTAGLARHSSRTASPTMPVAPVMMVLIVMRASPRRYRLDLDQELRPIESRHLDQRHGRRGRRRDARKETVARFAIGRKIS